MSPLGGSHAAYYVDATSGNDANDGLSDDQAWQTIGKVNGETFNPGDHILFKRGETWVGALLIVPSSGISGNPITLDAYGAGALPIIDGNDAVNCVTVANRNYLTIQNIEVAQGLNYGIHTDTSTHIIIRNCTGRDCGNAAIDLNTNSSFIDVSDCDLHDQYRRVVGATCGGVAIQDGCHDIAITDTDCYDGVNAACMGITIHNHVATTMPYNITLRRCACYSNDGNGIQIRKADAGVDTDRNILIDNCECYDNDVHGVYVFPIAAQHANGVTIKNCTLSRNATRCLYMRGDSFFVYENLIIADIATPVLMSGVDGLEFYNNTVVQTVAVVIGGSCILIDSVRSANYVVKNNIMYAVNGIAKMTNISGGTGVVGIDIDYNLYSAAVASTRWTYLGVAKNWTNWLADSGQDANSPTPADPLFTNAAIDDYTLQAGSPARGIGIELGFGTDLGAFQYGA